MVFDEPNLVSHAGLVPAMGLTTKAGLIELTDRWLTVPAYREVTTASHREMAGQPGAVAERLSGRLIRALATDSQYTEVLDSPPTPKP